MAKFFTMPEEHIENTITLTGNQAQHVHVLRHKIGDELLICEQGTDRCITYVCIITDLKPDRVVTLAREVYVEDKRMKMNLTLYQSLPKGDKMDSIVQKAVELGVSRIVPVVTARCIVRPVPERLPAKVARYQRIADEAAKQCGALQLTEVLPYCNLLGAIDDARRNMCNVACYERGGARIRDSLIDCKNVGIFIGCEGGYEPIEVEMLRQKIGARVCTLGKLILRCETASVVAVSAIREWSGDL